MSLQVALLWIVEAAQLSNIVLLIVGVVRLRRRVAEVERLQAGGCMHDWQLAWASTDGISHVERCSKCTAWQGHL